MDLPASPATAVQIIHLILLSDDSLSTRDSRVGKAWLDALQEISLSEGYCDLRWGRSVEEPKKVQLHVFRESITAHKSYLISPGYQRFLDLVRPILSVEHQEPKVRHVEDLTIFTSKPTTPFGAPVTGTAIYLSTSLAWHEGAWPCWTHVVRHVKGCTGIAGGRVLESLNTGDAPFFAGVSAPGTNSEKRYDNCYVVYVGWESIKDHNNYHHTKHFKDHGIILSIGNAGWSEYGHVKFEEWSGPDSPYGPKL